MNGHGADQGTSGHNGHGAGHAAGDSQPPRESIDDLEREIDQIRGNLGGLVGELDRRRRRAFDVRLQFREHRVPILVGGAVLLALVGGGIALGIVRRRRAQALPARARAFAARARGVREAVRRAASHPDRVARAGNGGVVDERSFLRRIVEAGALAGAGVAGRQLVGRALKR
jgi:hypothetical protein